MVNKRKAEALAAANGEEEALLPPRRSTRWKASDKGFDSGPAAAAAASTKTKGIATLRKGKVDIEKSNKEKPRKKASKKAVKPKLEAEAGKEPKAHSNGTTTTKNPAQGGGGQQFWLMKAEPESRIEKGKDIKFSIDDLAAKTKPEPWDGIRNFGARNNLRAMKKGDLAFFYHSSCKEPGIVGIMEIVEEHSPDMTAQDPTAPYHDPKDTDPSNPKWSVVHVSYRGKLKEPIFLPELRKWGEKGGALEEMQMLRMGRMSVSRVSGEEWTFLMGVAEERGGFE